MRVRKLEGMLSARVRSGSLAWTLRFLFVVGLLWHTPVRGEEPADPIVFAAYNLKNYLKMERRVGGEVLEDAPKPEKEIAAVISMLRRAHPSVLGVTEIGQESDVEDLKQRLQRAGIPLPHHTLCAAFDPERRVALLSRFPIVDIRHQTGLAYTLGAKRIAFQRGILDATIEIHSDYRLRLLGAHLKSKRDLEEADQEAMRRNEAHLLRRHMDGILQTSPETNLLVFGDFNDTRNEQTIKAVQGGFGTEAYMKDLQVEDALGHRWTYYWNFADQYSRFDFIFVNKALLPEVEMGKSHIVSGPEWFQASDHRPVVAIISPVNR